MMLTREALAKAKAFPGFAKEIQVDTNMSDAVQY